MFTGIVEGTGEVRDRERKEGGLRLRIASDAVSELSHGQSVSVSGVCLTVEESGSYGVGGEGPNRGGEWFDVFLAEETVARSYLADLGVGDRVNVERAMPADGRFDGHIVQGHVDGVARLTGHERLGDDWGFTFELPEGYDRYVVEKGSITLDGISLTVADRDGREVDVAIVPTTYELTTLSEKRVGDPVHLEVDVLAKYVEQMLESGVTGWADRSR